MLLLWLQGTLWELLKVKISWPLQKQLGKKAPKKPTVGVVVFRNIFRTLLEQYFSSV